MTDYHCSGRREPRTQAKALSSSGREPRLLQKKGDLSNKREADLPTARATNSSPVCVWGGAGGTPC